MKTPGVDFSDFSRDATFAVAPRSAGAPPAACTSFASPASPVSVSSQATCSQLGWHIGEASIPLTLEGYSRLQFVRQLTPEQKRLSIRQIWGHEALVQNLVRGWTPERDDELNALARAEEHTRASKGSTLESKGEYIDHYLYFSKKSDAQEAARRLRAKGWFAEVSRPADDKAWLALGKQPAPIHEEFESIRQELESLAEELHGEYDGWGAAI